MPSRSHFKEAFGFQNYNALGLPCQSNGWPLALPLRGAPVPSLVKELRSYMLYHAAKKKLQYLHPRTYTICKNTFSQSLFTHLLFGLPFSPLDIIVCHTHKTEKRRKRRCTPLYPDSQRLFLSDLHLATLSRMSLYLLQLSYKQIHLFLSGIFFFFTKIESLASAITRLSVSHVTFWKESKSSLIEKIRHAVFELFLTLLIVFISNYQPGFLSKPYPPAG